MVTSQRVINSHRKKLLWISIGAVEALLLLVGLIALVVYLNEAPIVPSRDALDPLPSELREVASFVAENNGGGRVPSDLYMVLESRKGGSLQDGLDQLGKHLSDRGWSKPQPEDWGFFSRAEDGTTLDYGVLDEYLGLERQSGIADELLLEFLEERRGSNRLLLIL